MRYNLLFLLTTLISQFAFAIPCTKYVVALNVGRVWESGGEAQTLNLAPSIEKTYTANKRTKNLAQGEIFLGIQTPLPRQLLGQIGLAFAAVDNATPAGQIWDDGDPIFANYTYQYKVKHEHIAIKGKLVGDWGWPIMPWISGSVGIGFNRAYDFTNTPLIFEAVPNANFTGKTINAFTYTVGIGLQRMLDNNWQLGLGYEFTDWGKSQLSAAPGQTTSHGLTLSHLYTSGLFFNLSYIV